jgi:hypothetical protein
MKIRLPPFVQRILNGRFDVMIDFEVLLDQDFGLGQPPSEVLANSGILGGIDAEKKGEFPQDKVLPLA